MVQIIDRQPTFLERISPGLQDLAAAGGQYFGKQMAQERQTESLHKQGLGHLAGLPPELQQIGYSEQLKGENQRRKFSEEIMKNRQVLRDLENRRGLDPGSLAAYENDPKIAETITRPAKENKTPTTEKPVPKDVSRKINQILTQNPKASADELRIKMDEADIPPVYSNPYTENRRRSEEQAKKSEEDRIRALRQETLPFRKEIADKAFAAQAGIENKERLLDLIEKGDIDDPTFATLAEALPLNLGKRLLSNDTVEYKAGMIEEFGDLRNLFKGQTRIKEIELLEQKIADLYLTDDQKKAILKSRINALKADVIRAEVAQEIENESLGVLQFQQELEKRSKPRLEALFNRILDEQKSIIQDAENKKKMALNPKDSEDFKLMQQILKEAGGDRNKALEIAKKKGYSKKA